MFNKYKIRTRLLLLLGVALVTLLILSLSGGFFANGVKNDLKQFAHDILDQGDRLTAVRDIYSYQIPYSLYRISQGQLSESQGFDLIHKLNQSAQNQWSQYVSGTSYIQTAELAAKHRSLNLKIQEMIQKLDESLLKLQNSLKDNSEALNQYLSQNFYNDILPIDQTLSELDKIYSDDAKSDFQSVMNDIDNYNFIRYAALFISLVILISLFYLIFKSIVSPLNYTTDNVKKLAKGDTSFKVDISSGGELGILEQAMQEMIDSSQKMGGTLTTLAQGDPRVEVIPRAANDSLGFALSEMVKQMRHMVNKMEEIAHGDLSIKVEPRSEHDIIGNALSLMLAHMQTMIGKMQEGINTLAASSQETMTSVSQLTAGAAETATAVTETTTTIEELKQTSLIAAEKAKDVLQNAEQTLQTAQESEKTVSTTLLDMKQIQERMQIISDSILKLSEKSLAIAEVMNTVNDIAEQSNTLAVNAAIEATKAGEQGRGFGIVAQEIRSLAEQSKGATVQVRSLLNEIQSATNAAVLATEQGSKAVIKGVDQSTSISSAIRTLGEKMTGVTQAANQIVYSSQQQIIGIEQVTVAMTNINQATNQHLDHLRQIETAVETLNSVGADLKELTDQYKLDSSPKNKKINYYEKAHV